MGVLIRIFDERGFINMEISLQATMNDVIIQHKRKRHRVKTYNEVEDIIYSIKDLRMEGDDVNLWKRGSDYHTSFTTHETWELTRLV